jgi:hypothetical protein
MPLVCTLAFEALGAAEGAAEPPVLASAPAAATEAQATPETSASRPVAVFDLIGIFFDAYGVS